MSTRAPGIPIGSHQLLSETKIYKNKRGPKFAISDELAEKAMLNLKTNHLKLGALDTIGYSKVNDLLKESKKQLLISNNIGHEATSIKDFSPFLISQFVNNYTETGPGKLRNPRQIKANEDAGNAVSHAVMLRVVKMKNGPGTYSTHEISDIVSNLDATSVMINCSNTNELLVMTPGTKQLNKKFNRSAALNMDSEQDGR